MNCTPQTFPPHYWRFIWGGGLGNRRSVRCRGKDNLHEECIIPDNSHIIFSGVPCANLQWPAQ